MFLFGHIGIGSRIIGPWTRTLPRSPVLLGTVLPDLVDKPLYYLKVLFVGKESNAFSLISGTRTFGHTAVFLLLLSVLAFIRRSKVLAAICLGVGSHLILDSWSDHFLPISEQGSQSALLWMIADWTFPLSHYNNPIHHLTTLQKPIILYSELAGIMLFVWDQRKNNQDDNKTTKNLFR